MQLEFIADNTHQIIQLDSDLLERMPQKGWQVTLRQYTGAAIEEVSGMVTKIEHRIQIQEDSAIESLIFHLE